MREIKKLCGHMLDEVRRAERYAKCALGEKDVRPTLAETYRKMGESAYGCAKELQERAQSLVSEQIENGAEPPKFMTDKWESRHDDFVGRMAMARIYLDMYR